MNDGFFTRLTERMLGYGTFVRPLHRPHEHWWAGDTLHHDSTYEPEPSEAKLVSATASTGTPTPQPAPVDDMHYEVQPKSITSEVGEIVFRDSRTPSIGDEVVESTQPRRSESVPIPTSDSNVVSPRVRRTRLTESTEAPDVSTNDEPSFEPAQIRTLVQETVTERKSRAFVPGHIPISNIIVSPVQLRDPMGFVREVERVAPPTVNVIVDRIEIRAMKDTDRLTPRRKKKAVHKPNLGLDEYLTSRSRADR